MRRVEDRIENKAEEQGNKAEEQGNKAGWKEEWTEGKTPGTGRQERSLSGSTAAKTLFFLLFTVSFAVGIACFGLCYYMGENFFYTLDSRSVVERSLSTRGVTKARMIRDYINRGDLAGAKRYCDNSNFNVELRADDLWDGEDVPIWSSFDPGQGEADKEGCALVFTTMSFYAQDLPTIGNYTLNGLQDYLFSVYIDLDFPMEDDLKQVGEGVLMLHRARYGLIGAAAVCLLVCVSCFAFLMCGAGRRNGREGIVPGVLTGLPFDFLALTFAGGAVVCCRYISRSFSYMDRFISGVQMLTAVGTLLAVLAVVFFSDLAIRVRQGGVLRRTIVYVLLRGIRRGAAWAARAVPSAVVTVIGFLAVCTLELVLGGFMLEYVAYTVRPAKAIKQIALLWGLEKLILFVAVLYVASTCKRLLKAGRALAGGQKGCRVDTSGMFGSFKEHGENLNSLGQGIDRAVEERMKSEHLKTELITNVSHDLKTPLTSIINYAELICAEKTENGKLEEYAEVLFRQSRRLKKLLEDLIEASKATTGSLEVKLEPCEAGVLLTQAMGEYQHRMEEKGLELIVRQPEEPVRIMADGRHLWRVFDNLLNNICKYSREHSRVYLSIEVREGRAYITFRNMSKYILDVPPDELEERFVRGDKSRHMEGSGLGLAIAGSLMELQGGRMEVVTDGDLFKVILSFEILA